MTKGVIRKTAMKISEVITVEVSEFTTELTEEEEMCYENARDWLFEDLDGTGVVLE